MPANIPNAPTLATRRGVVDLARAARNPDAAWKFIKFDAGKKWAVERAKVANWMPTAQRHRRRSGDQGRSDCSRSSSQIGNNARSYPLPSPIWAEIAANDIVDAVQKALLAPEKTEEIFKDLDARLTKKLKDI